MKFEILIVRLRIRGFFLWYDPEDKDFGCSLWFSFVTPENKNKKFLIGFTAPS